VTLSAFLGVSAAVQVVFLGLDLADRHATRAERHGGEPLRRASLFFLLGIIGVFLAIQVAGFSLAPRVDALVDRVRAFVAPGVLPAGAPSGWRFLVLSMALFYIAGFVDYAWHRWFSHHRLFWFTHESHHLRRRSSSACRDSACGRSRC
jgi:sterol desaturase/sphingolipid hydroxylase (fatty acid hydroxylase superfamily)